MKYASILTLSGLVVLTLSGCDVLLDFDKLRDGHGDGGHGDMASASDLAGDMAGAPDGSCAPTASGPFFDNADVMDVPLTTGTQLLTSLAAVDVNNDHKLDLVFSGNDRMLYVWLNMGNRTFMQLAGQAGGCAATDFSLTTLVGDFDKDGNVDVVLDCLDPSLNAVENSLYFLKGMGNGMFATAVAMTNQPMYANLGVAYDVDDDGAVDAVVADTANDLYVFWGGSGFVSGTPAEVDDVLPDEAALSQIVGGPFSDDGTISGGLLVAYTGSMFPGGGGFQIVRQGPTRTLSADTVNDLFIADPSNEPVAVGVGNLNTDSLPDVVSALYEPGPNMDGTGGNKAGLLNLYLGESAAFGPKISTTPTDSLVTPISPEHIAIGDLNKDSLDDVVLTHFQSVSDQAFYDRFEVWTPVAVSGTTKLQCVFQHNVTSSVGTMALEPDHPVIADIDGDGHADIMITMEYTGSDTTAVSAVRFAWGQGH